MWQYVWIYINTSKEYINTDKYKAYPGTDTSAYTNTETDKNKYK